MFKLNIAADRTDEAIQIQFYAEDAAAALIYAQREAGNRAAELWQGDQKLCTIRRAPVGNDEFWRLS